MQKIIMFLLVLVILVAGCRKSGSKPGMLEGRIVRVNCASFVVEVLNNNGIGQDNWKDITTDKFHNNAIAAANKCEMPDKAIVGKIIRFDTDAILTFAGCVTCDMFDAPPTAVYTLRNVTVKN